MKFKGGTHRKTKDNFSDSQWMINTGDCPVPMGTVIDVKYRDGHVESCIGALMSEEYLRDGIIRTAVCWSLNGTKSDIICWKLSKKFV